MTTEGALRVAHLLAGFNSAEGQARVVSTLASSLPGEHVLVCGRAEGDTSLFSEVVQIGSPPRRFGALGGDALCEALQELAPTVVHFHGGPIGAMAVAPQLSGIPSVATIYGWPRVTPESFRRGVSLRDLVRTPVLAPRTVANTLVPPSVVGSVLRRAGVGAVLTADPRVRDLLACAALPVGLYAGTTPPAISRRDPPSPAHLVFAGRAERTRGADLLAAAVERLRRRGRDVRASFFLLDHTHTEQLIREVAGEGCSVHVGPVDLGRAMEDATAVVLPFRHDATTAVPAQVATEALARGVPVIGGDVHCMRAAVAHGRTGLLVRPGALDPLVEAIESLLDDPALGRRLGEQGAEEIRRRWAAAGVTRFSAWAYDLVAPATAGASAPDSAVNLEETSLVGAVATSRATQERC